LQVRWSGPDFGEEVIWPAVLPDDLCNTGDPECDLNGICAAIQDWVGGAINTASGNHIYGATDLRLAAVGESLRFERVYASQMAERNVAGCGRAPSGGVEPDRTTGC
jgi:hypothetical protein